MRRCGGWELPPADLRRRLLDHFAEEARDLPWRRTDDPYAIWVSEIMLQQTRVSTVVPYFERWMERFPDIDALADADRDEVLKRWEGLGYYRRARMLHRAARVVRDRYDGSVPDTAEGLRALPGVGPYTAGAVASIAFGRAEPAVDGNVRRVLSRLFDLPEPTAAELRDLAADLVDPERPGDFNQALMELGATICTPRSPDCPACPVSDLCRARARGVAEERPLPKERAGIPERVFQVAVPVIRARETGSAATVLVRRPADGLLGGLWEFPTVEAEGNDGSDGGDGSDGSDGADALELAALRHLSVDLAEAKVRALATVRHVYSHFRGVYRVALVTVAAAGDLPEADPEGRPVVVVGLDEVEDYPRPVVQQKVLALVRSALADDTRLVPRDDGQGVDPER